MTGRLAEVKGRIGSVRKLGAVIGAMRGIASARVQDATQHVAAIRAYAETIGDAIAEALVLLPSAASAGAHVQASQRHAVILMAAEQGFAGTYNEQVFDAAASLLNAPHVLFLVGDRGVLIAGERHHPPHWSDAMIAHPAQAGPLVSRLADALLGMLASAEITHVTVVHAIPVGTGSIEIVTRRVLPFDYARFPPPAAQVSPRITLPADRLLARLVEEYIVAELLEAVMLAFVAENVARMRAMISAQDNVSETLDALVGTARRLRQEEITEEIVELAAGHPRD
ncbi:hypothetical protein CEW88_19760 (plasmid) [Alloyangia pacifica]|uniref:F-type H+-transporting ATPase subunit gamma n=1 Tax=Alloyangia pacifica TaxID=311180 RepID=A0A2U8HKB5_9RHOB|nr:FoF1 ATP synthase subunit gamma [Alloyangia pacifica]AWI86000.1 hypothetical protein CEW88_19760 [Alloyangia pacifica]